MEAISNSNTDSWYVLCKFIAKLPRSIIHEIFKIFFLGHKYRRNTDLVADMKKINNLFLVMTVLIQTISLYPKFGHFLICNENVQG